MKRIRLNNSFILKENSRFIDRVNNLSMFYIAVEVIFGATYSQAIADASVQDVLEITAAKNQTLWNKNKDASQQDFVQNLYDFMAYYYPEVIKWFAWNDAAVMRTIPNPIPNGDPITQRVPYDDPSVGGNQALIDQLMGEKILGTDFRLFRSLYDRGITTFVLEDV
jgi:hypothetical protein